MNEHSLFDMMLVAWFALAAAVFVALFFIAAPYGRHTRNHWGLTMRARLGWLMMEAPSPLLFAALFVLGRNSLSWPIVILFIMWQAHYLHRSFIYPFTIRGAGKRMTVLVMALGILFNSGNTYLNGRYLFTFSGGYAASWLLDPRFIAGVALFVAGYVVNRKADAVLRTLRKPGESGYKVPQGRIYQWVSCPNYLGEIAIWTGWALATWSLPGLAFAVWTFANLAPRARAHHKWYRSQFQDYPPQRKALIPGLW